MKIWNEQLRLAAALLAVVLIADVVHAELVAHWKFDENMGTRVTDSSGNGYHGSVIGGSPYWDSDGKYGGCLSFNNTCGVSIPKEVFKGIRDEITISVWVNGDAQQKNYKTVIFQAGAGDAGRPHIISLYTRWQKYGLVEFVTGYKEPDLLRYRADKDEWAGYWNHYVFVKDTDKGFQKIYVNGKLKSERRGTTAELSGVGKASIGIASEYPLALDLYIGKLDDIRIYDRVLRPTEVAQLYRSEPLEPGWESLVDAFVEAGEMINYKPGKAIAFLEEKIAECDKWKRESESFPYERLSFGLHFRLAQAKEAAGFSKKDIDLEYQRAFAEGRPSLSNCASVLGWLLENGMREQSRLIVEYFIENDLDYLKKVAAKSEGMIDEGKVNSAIEFLEANLDIYTQWRAKHPFDAASAENSLPKIYFLLAEANRLTGSPKKAIAEAYSKVFSPLVRNFAAQQSSALQWLLENGFIEKCRNIIDPITRSSEVSGPLTEVVRSICRDCQSKGDWHGFKQFLEVLLTEAEHPYEWMRFLESCFSGESNRWSQKYSDYLDNNPGLKFSRDIGRAERYYASENYTKAAELYEELVDGCESEAKARALRFEICKCLFSGGEYRRAVSKLEDYISDNKTINRNLVKDAVLMKGRAHLQLGELDQSMDILLRFMLEYPEAEEVPEAGFLMGYCYMLQSKFEQSKEALNIIVQDYPGSEYSEKAQIYLSRIANMIR